MDERFIYVYVWNIDMFEYKNNKHKMHKEAQKHRQNIQAF